MKPPELYSAPFTLNRVLSPLKSHFTLSYRPLNRFSIHHASAHLSNARLTEFSLRNTLFSFSPKAQFSRLIHSPYSRSYKRTYSTATAIRSPLTSGRLIFGSLTALSGYATYQISTFSNWLDDKKQTLFEESCVALVHAIDAWNAVDEQLSSFGEGLIHKAMESTFAIGWPSWFGSKKSKDLTPTLVDTTISNEEHFNQSSSPHDNEMGESVLFAGSDGDESSAFSINSTQSVNSLDRDGDFSILIRKMIEIRELLRISQSEELLKLPRIVVIGSQSSGKSSVLETLVGHHFLPKGSNMITRRPLELTLVHTPNTAHDYAVFPTLYHGKPIYDFNKVNQILTEMNASVPNSLCVSDEPIELIIHSRHVPDLSMVDLPGYIAITNRHQPSRLRAKIADLCDKYISEPNNIILAVSAADVDLANSESLKASRLVDPHGERTLGVITKMDLVEPRYGATLLENKDYPLSLGYIGVICNTGRLDLEDDASSTTKPSSSGKLFSSFLSSHPSPPSPSATSSPSLEAEFFKENSAIFQSTSSQIGVKSLRRNLMEVLEKSMFTSLDSITEVVQGELEELDYKFKVDYNDQPISVDSYVSYMLTRLKLHFREVARKCSRIEIREKILRALEDKCFQVLEAYIWNQSESNEQQVGHMVPPSNETMSKAVSALTKSNLGRLSGSLLSKDLMQQISLLATSDPFRHHPNTMSALLTTTESALKDRLLQISHQIENALKPFKYGTDFTPAEWLFAREKTVSWMGSLLRQYEIELASLNKDIGSKRLKQLIAALKSENTGKQQHHNASFADSDVSLGSLFSSGTPSSSSSSSPSSNSTTTTASSSSSFSSKSSTFSDDYYNLKNPYLVERAREALALENRIHVLKSRLRRLRESPCCTTPSSIGHYQKSLYGSNYQSWYGWFVSWMNPFSWMNYSNSHDRQGYSASHGRSASAQKNAIDADYFDMTLMSPLTNRSSGSSFHERKQDSAPVYEIDPSASSSSIENKLIIIQDPCQNECPEVYLQLLLGRLINTTVLYLHYELVQNFLNSFPEQLTTTLCHSASHSSSQQKLLLSTSSFFKEENGNEMAGFSSSSKGTVSDNQDKMQLSLFARENPLVDAQLKLQERRACLYIVKEKLAFLKLTREASRLTQS